MMTVTDNAAAVIRDLTSAPQVPGGSGLRIATDPDEGSLTLSLSTQPLDGDEVVDTDGALIFLDAQTASLLADKTLDADVDTDGAVSFILAEVP
jgi:Fe-S cluster assembly iron-binding protein IscA